MSGPRMGMSQMNGNNRRAPLDRQPPSHQQHDDLIKYICDSWNKVSQEGGTSVIFYQEHDHQNLKDFAPFDLEAFWGRRLVQNLENHRNS